MAADPDRVRRLLGRAELGWLVERLRRRMELGRPLTGTLTRPGATQAERAALDALLGRARRPGSGTTVQLDDLVTVLRRADAADCLADAITALVGPVAAVSAERIRTEMAWAQAHAVLAAIGTDRPVLAGWAEEVRATGLLRRLATTPDDALQLADRVAAVLAALPADGLPLSVLASRTVRHGHALDDGHPLATLVLRAAAAIVGLPPGEPTRTVWAAVGVLSGELNNPVLTLNLDDRSGEPGYLTVRRLIRNPREWAVRGTPVYVCENPAVVAAAADELGALCAALVCVRGYPAAAATVLLRQLADAGADLRYHGDFDWPGITIAGLVLRRFGAHPWRLDEAAYRAAARAGGRPLAGRAQPTPWDGGLSVAMRELGVQVEEERVLDDLLADLRP
jgi:uncharacterized protein (TIGR02679 family)